jgi:hypothetical protein
MSLPPPGANGTMTFTGFEGYGCARADVQRKNDTNSVTKRIGFPLVSL